MQSWAETVPSSIRRKRLTRVVLISGRRRKKKKEKEKEKAKEKEKEKEKDMGLNLRTARHPAMAFGEQ